MMNGSQPVCAGSTILTSLLSRTSCKLLVAVLMLLAFPFALAACEVQPQYPLSADRGIQRATLQYLQGVQDQCLRNSHYYAWRGALELSLGRNQAALESLERALLLEPDLPGAQLDYVQALLTQGDTVAAEELLKLLVQRNDLPPVVQELLGQRQTQTQMAATQAYAGIRFTRWQISSALGWDSNLNSAPRTDTLQLSIPSVPGGSLSLPLARSSQPQSGALWLSQVAVQHLQPVGSDNSSALLVSAQLANRSTTTSAKTTYQQVALAAQWLQAPQASEQWVLSSSYSYLRYGSQPWFDELQLTVQRQYQWGRDCRLSAGLKWEQRSWQSSAELNGRYQGLLTSLDCSIAFAVGSEGSAHRNHIAWGGQLSRGHDQPVHAARPGGRYTRTELRAYAGLVQGPWQFNGSWYYQQQSDNQGYSPLLDQGSPRRTHRQSWELQVSRALRGGEGRQAATGQLRGFVSLQHSQQQSNLSIFSMRQHSLHLGLRWLH